MPEEEEGTSPAGHTETMEELNVVCVALVTMQDDETGKSKQ